MRKFAILLSALISLLLSFNAFALEIEYNNPNNPNEPTVYASTPAKIVTIRMGIDGRGYIMIYAYSFKRVN